MSTLLCFHAHPDDECLITGGLIARAVREGHRVVLVVATGGEEGEYPEGFISSREELGPVRAQELDASAKILGVEKVYMLGYRDSGMAGTPENLHPECFANADLQIAAASLASILRDEGVDALTVYDSNGGYGHPDHIMVHQVGIAAAEIAGVSDVLEATMNMDYFQELMRAMPAEQFDELPEEMRSELQGSSFGMPASAINTEIDVSEYVELKYRALSAHLSQRESTGFAFALDRAIFDAAFGKEWFISRSEAVGTRRASLF